jgi:hypothetical protein
MITTLLRKGLSKELSIKEIWRINTLLVSIKIMEKINIIEHLL